MNMTSEQVPASVPVTILRLMGDVDGSNYREIISRSHELHRAGARHLLIDLGDVPFMSSAGLVALNNIALLFIGKQAPDPEDGWQAIHAVSRAGEAGLQVHVKLLNPRPQVARVLKQTGLLSFFQVYDDQATALASF